MEKGRSSPKKTDPMRVGATAPLAIRHAYGRYSSNPFYLQDFLGAFLCRCRTPIRAYRASALAATTLAPFKLGEVRPPV